MLDSIEERTSLNVAKDFLSVRQNPFEAGINENSGNGILSTSEINEI